MTGTWTAISLAQQRLRPIFLVLHSTHRSLLVFLFILKLTTMLLHYNMHSGWHRSDGLVLPFPHPSLYMESNGWKRTAYSLCTVSPHNLPPPPHFQGSGSCGEIPNTVEALLFILDLSIRKKAVTVGVGQACTFSL